MVRAAQQAAEAEVYSPVDMNSILQTLEKIVKIQSITIGEENRCSTGSICLDIVLGGGITAGMYTFSGAEQSAKTTLAIMMLAASVNQDVGLRVLWDAENSSGSSMDYVENVFDTQGVHADMETLFGVRKKGKYTVTPMIYYRDEGEMDTFYNWLSGLLRRLPDKRFEAERWWYVYPPTPENKAAYKGKYDRNLSAANNGLYIPAPSGALQAMILVDSYPSLLPTSMDEDDPKSGMALQAREFSRHIPRVKGKLRSKRVALLGVNQLRIAPAQMFKDPNYEPGGEALKFNCMSSDTLLLTSRGVLTAEELSMSGVKGIELCGRSGLEKPSAFEQKGYSQLLQLRTKNGVCLKGKPGHKVLTLNVGDLTPEFRTLEDLQSSDHGVGSKYVALKVGSNVFPDTNPKLEFKGFVEKSKTAKSVTIPEYITPDLAYVIGALVGDGHVRGGGAGLVNSDAAVIAKFKRICEKSFSVKVGINKKKATCLAAGFNSVELGQFLAYIGLGEKSSHTKEVPWVIRRGTRDVQAAFLAGHLDTDKFHTSSMKLNQQIVTMLLNFGIAPGNAKPVKDNFFKHGTLLSFDKPTRKFNQKAVKAGVFGVSIYGHYYDKLDSIFGPYRANQEKRKNRETTRSGRRAALSKFENRVGGEHYVLPTGDVAWRKESSKLIDMFQQLKDDGYKSRSNRLFYDDRAAPVISAMRSLVPSLRTAQERGKALLALDKYQAFVDLCKNEGLVFVEIDDVKAFNERDMTYDGNMPKTSTIVTQGIVSHNSDARLRSTARALSGVPYNPVGKGQIEKEVSISGEGEDTYRYIHVKAIKNKLSVPGRETWMRIWVQDDDSKARGFCPVWDTFYALHMTGQVYGKRASMLLDIHGLGPAKKNITWAEFKRLILGTKEEKALVCKKLGYKPINLRSGMFNLMRKGVLEDLYAEQHKTALKKAKAKAAAAEADEEDEDGED